MAATRISGMRYGIIDNSSRGLLAVWAHGQRQTRHGLHLGLFAFPDRLLADGVPDFSLQDTLPRGNRSVLATAIVPTMLSAPVTGRRIWDFTASHVMASRRAPKVTTVGIITDTDTFMNGASVFTSRRAPKVIAAMPPKLSNP